MHNDDERDEAEEAANRELIRNPETEPTISVQLTRREALLLLANRDNDHECWETIGQKIDAAQRHQRDDQPIHPAPNLPGGYAESRRGEIARQLDHASTFRRWATQCSEDANRADRDDHTRAHAAGRAAAYLHAANLIAQAHA